MNIISGADGCREGWVVVTKNLDTDDISWQVCPTLADFIIQTPPPLAVAIDMPIGLTETGPRICDQEARRLLGRPRGSSVFPAPIRGILRATSYSEACSIRYGLERKKISLQTYHILPKIREVDEFLHRSPNVDYVREAHPEVCFYHLAGGRPMKNKKKRLAGRKERLDILKSIFGEAPTSALKDSKLRAAQKDDILDAFATLWTAERIVTGNAITYPKNQLWDSFGLRMEIVA